MIKSTYWRSRRDPDVQKYVLEEQEAFNGLLKSYKGHKENEWLAVSKIGIVGLKI